jgi:hypothetical protein
LLALFLVNSPLDTVDANLGDGIAQDAAGQTTLRSAVMEANARTGDDTIVLAADTYRLSLAGANEDGAASGDVDVAANGRITINGSGPATTLIDAAGLGDRVFQVLALGNLSISGVTVLNGDSRSAPVGQPGDGGGFLNAGTLSINSAVVSANEARDSGGGVANVAGGTLTITDSTIAANLAPTGAGIYVAGGIATLTRSTVSGNSAAVGAGGISNQDSTLTVVNSTISGNEAQGHGGGIVNTGQLTIRNSTISDNSAGMSGGGVYNTRSGSVTAQNTIFAENESLGDGAADFDGTANSLGDNLIGDSSGSSGWTTSDFVDIDPLLGPLANNGGPTQTHALWPGSPAIDAGNNADPPATDQRGATFARIVNGTIDIGAFESQSFRFVVDTLVDENDGIYVAGDLSLREAIFLANGNPGHDTIEFAPPLLGSFGATIVLSLGELPITNDLTVIGPGANRLAISGNGSRAVNVAAGTSATLSGLTVRDGRAEKGGGISNSGALTITDSDVTGNTGSRLGGGISNSGTLTITNSSVTGNSTSGLGGGIYNSASGRLSVIASTIANNSATSAAGDIRGGAIYNLGQVTLASSTLSTNSASGPASSGGGVYSRSGSVSITNSTISGNSANQTGGIDNNAELTIKHSTVTRNSRTASAAGPTGVSGGITNSESGTVTVQNTIISGNGGSGTPDFSGTVTSLGDNLVGDTSESTGWLANDLQGVDPRLGALASNGGPTRTHALLNGSPAIDAGNNEGAPAADQRGLPRIVNETIDIGAYERQAENFVIDTAVDENDGNHNAGDVSLREAILLAAGTPGHDVIEFAPALADATIRLTLGELVMNSDVTLLGLGANRLAVSGNDSSRVFNIPNTATVEIHGLTIRDGQAVELGGGVSNSGTLTLVASTIRDNIAVHGGGIYNTGTLTVESSSIVQNAATPGGTHGGGLFSMSGAVTITNSTISGNRAVSSVGIYNNGAMTIRNSTVTANAAQIRPGSISNSGEPGGIANSFLGTLSIQNTIVAGNSVRGFPRAPDVLGAFHSLGNNLIGNPYGSSGWIASDLVGTPAVPINPRLGSLTDNGGPTLTHALLANSPAIDAGSNAGASGVDQRGNPRPVDANGDGQAVVDIGAFEVGVSSQQFHGTEGDDAYVVQLDATGINLQVSGPGTNFTAPLASSPLLAFNTLGGNDQVVVDFINGNPLPAVGMEFLGGLHGNSGTPLDRLVFRNAQTASGSYRPISSTEAFLNVDGKQAAIVGVEYIDASGFESLTVVKSDRPSLYIWSRTDGGGVEVFEEGSDINVLVTNVETLIVDAATNEDDEVPDSLNVRTSGDLPIGLIRYLAGTGNNSLLVGERGGPGTSGSVRIDSSADPSGALNTSVEDRVQLITSRILQNSLTIGNQASAVILPDGTDAATSVLTNLTINPGGRLDINDNALIVDYTGDSPAATIRSKIAEGRGGAGIGNGKWAGTGITSSIAQQINATMPEARSVGYAENGTLPLGPYTTFRGQPVDSTSVLIAYTRTADANLDGVVNDDDVTIVGATYAPGLVQPHWALGDFEYNGFVDDNDVTLLGAFYDPASGPIPAPPLTKPTSSLADDTARNRARLELFSALAAEDDSTLNRRDTEAQRRPYPGLRPVLSDARPLAAFWL